MSGMGKESAKVGAFGEACTSTGMKLLLLTISAGQSTGDAVNFVSNSTKLAKAGFTDAGSALDVLTMIMNAYGLESTEVTDVCDTLIYTPHDNPYNRKRRILARLKKLMKK